jgi:hypothetical protein
LAEDPTRSTRSIALDFDKDHVSVHRVLKSENLRPFHYTEVQELKEGDYQKRVDFCTWLIGEHEADENFTQKILWTDESIFQREGCWNPRNQHFWDYQNPRLKRVRNFQNRWSVHVWCGMIDKYIVIIFCVFMTGTYDMPYADDHSSRVLFIDIIDL